MSNGRKVLLEGIRLSGSATGRSNGRGGQWKRSRSSARRVVGATEGGWTLDLLDHLVHRPRRAASGWDGRPRPIIFGVL